MDFDTFIVVIYTEINICIVFWSDFDIPCMYLYDLTKIVHVPQMIQPKVLRLNLTSVNLGHVLNHNGCTLESLKF